MTTKEKIASLVEQSTELPEEAQAELVETLIEMRTQHTGVYRLDEAEREALGRSAEDVRLGRLVSEEEMEGVFRRYRA